MISFRTHVVTLVAVFLALAVGVVLGGGPLSELGRGTGENVDALEQRVEEVEAQIDAADRFAAESSSTLVGGGLADQQIAVVVFPGAPAADVEATLASIEQAGGAVTTVQEIGSSLVNPGEKALVDTLGAQLMGQAGEGEITASATTYERAGELLAFSVATTKAEGDQASAESKAVADGFKGANLVPEVTPIQGRAPLVLAILGPDVEGDGADEIVGGLVRGLATGSRGTVVVGRTSDGDDQMARLRDSDGFGNASSVDGVETESGRVSAVLALSTSAQTRGGSYGATGSDGSLPLG